MKSFIYLLFFIYLFLYFNSQLLRNELGVSELNMKLELWRCKTFTVLHEFKRVQRKVFVSW